MDAHRIRSLGLVALLLLTPFARGGWQAAWRVPSAPPAALEGLPPTVGDPLEGAADVRLVRSLVHRVPAGESVAIHLETTALADPQRLYLRYQLLVLEYPRIISFDAAVAAGAEAEAWHIVGADRRVPSELVAVATAGPYRLLHRDR